MSVTLQTLITLFLFAAEAPQGVSMEDFFRKECETGKQESCDRLTLLSEGLVKQKRLEERSIEFWKNINTQELMSGNKPDLQAAYPLVMQDYFRSEAESGSHETLNEKKLPECAHHYHNHWLNKKMWWPANEDGAPDWPSIYNFIVDHYYGFCLRQK